ncbi:hypothetical protein JCM3775_001804 [Rhodotorula graminis]
MAAEPSLGVNPSLLTLDPGPPVDELGAAPAALSREATPEEGVYIVDKIVDFCRHDNKDKVPQDQWIDPQRRWEIRYLVSNSWEPREMFESWVESYDQNIADIEAADPAHPKLAALEREVKRLNSRWRKQEKERKREERAGRKVKPAERKVKEEEKDKGEELEGQGEGKSRAQQDEGKADDRGGPKPKRTRSSTSRANSAASSSTLAGRPAGPPPTRTRRTRRSAVDGDIDPNAWHEYLETNAPPSLRKLRFTPPPERDANGRLVSPPSDSERGNIVDERVASSSVGLGIAGAGAEDTDMGEAASAPARATVGTASQLLAGRDAHEQRRSTMTAGGFAGSDDGEGSDDAVAARPTSSSVPTAGFGGFAHDDDDESDDAGAGPYFPHLVPLVPSPSQQPSLYVAQAQGVAGSASLSHDVKPDLVSPRLDADYPMEATTVGPAQEDGATWRDDERDGEHERAPAASASTALGQAGGFADSGSSDEEPLADVVAARAARRPLASALADAEDEDEKPHVSASRPVARRVWAGDSSDDDDDFVIVDAHAPPAALPPSSSSAPAARPAQPSGGFAQDSDDDDAAMSPPLQAPAVSPPPPQQQQQQQPVAAPSNIPLAQPAESTRSEGDGASTLTTNVPLLVNSTSSSRASASRRRSPSPEQPSRPSTGGPPSKRARTSKDVRSAGVDSSGDGSRDMSPPTNSRAQQLKRLKIPRIGQKPPAPPPPQPPPSSAPSPAADTNLQPAHSPIAMAAGDRGQPVSAISSETSSSDAHARKVLDPFNHGVKRAKSSGGYMIINADLLRDKKLSSSLAPGARYPPDVVTEVDKIRHLWGIRTPGVPVFGVYDFDGAMHLDGEPREVYITAPPDENVAGRDKSARAHLYDYEALQLVLSSIKGVKQADSARDSVTAVFVHASQLGKVGRFPDGLLALERFRMAENAVFFVYGAGEDRKRAMRPFWLPMTAFSFTSAAFYLNPARISALINEAPKMFSNLGHRTQFPWIPSQYFLRGGAFGPAADMDGREPRVPQQQKSARTVDLHSLAHEGKLAVAAVAPCSTRSRKSMGFPDLDDGPGYHDERWALLDKTYPPSQCFVDLNRLQQFVCAWRADYTQVRRWLVIATPEELATCSALDGIYLLSVEHAEDALGLA